jgi:hypothetical protein
VLSMEDVRTLATGLDHPEGIALGPGSLLNPTKGGTQQIAASPELLLHDATGTQFPIPTNVCFFGDGLATLAVSSLGGCTLSAVEIGLRGLALSYPTT